MIAFGLVFAALAFISSSLVQGYKGTDNRAVDTVADLTGGNLSLGLVLSGSQREIWNVFFSAFRQVLVEYFLAILSPV